ncbi:MAG: FkbM family methyltransferase [Ferruginibacter sp.]
MVKLLLSAYRSLPLFKGKLRLGKILFKKMVNRVGAIEFTAHQHINYKIPNTLENLGVELLINGIYEKSSVSFLKDKMKDGDVYFDIGANIGSIGLPIVKSKAGLKYYGFEASPVVFEYLQRNFKENAASNYELHNCLVHEDNDKQMKFYQSELYGKSSLAPTYASKYIEVNSLSINSFCTTQKIPSVNWVKIDVQGFELYVFKGMQQLLRDKKVHNILFEFENWAEEEAGLEKGAAQRYLSDLGYDFFDMNGHKINKIITEGSTMIWARPAA